MFANPVFITPGRDIMLTMCFAHCICFYGFKQDQLRSTIFDIFSLLSVIVWESDPGAKSCGQPIWLKLGTEVGCDEIFQKPLWLAPLTFSFGVTGGGLIFCPFSTKNPAFQGAFWKCYKTPLVNCAAKWIWPWTLL